MPLDDLREKIYNPDEETLGRRHEESPYDANVSLKSEVGDFGKEKKWEAPSRGLSLEQKEILKKASYVLGGIFLVVGIMVAVVMIRKSAFSENRVSITLIGMENAGSNEQVEYRLVYKNENRVKLKDAQIFLNYSDNFKPEGGGGLEIDNANNSHIALGDLAPYSQGEKTITGKFFAPAEAVVYLNANLEFTPSNFSSKFQSLNKIGVNIKTSPLDVEVEAPLDVISGKKIDYVVNYRNLSPNKYSNVKIQAVYPREFNFTSANPPASLGNETWSIGDLESGARGKIVISGNISGVRNDSKIVFVSISADNEKGETVVFGTKEKVTKIIASPLFIYQLANDKENITIDAGDSVYYDILFGNVGEIGLREAIVTMEIKSKIVDYAKLKAGKGFFNEASKTITWKASEIRELAILEPGSEKSFRFEIPILKYLPVKDEEDKNFTLDTLVKIDSPDIPTPITENKIISSNRLELKLNSPINLDVKGFYKDANIENFGPIPPTLNQETAYALHWKVTNVSNDLGNAQVTSFLPTGVKWTGKVYPEEEKGNLVYDERTNQLTWNLGKLKNGVGVTSSHREVSFQVSITPQINQVGKMVVLLDKSIFTGKDLFTNNDLKFEVDKKDTEFNEDPSIGYNFSVVQ